MKRFKRIIVATVVLAAAILLGVFVVPRNTKAYSTDKTAYKKAMATAILTCYDNYAFQSPLTLQEYDFNHSALSWGSTTVQIPNLNGDYNYIECYELINRYVDWVNSTDPTTESNFLVDKLGYTRTDGIPSGECFYFQYNYKYDDPGDAPNSDGWEYNVPTDYICADTINSDGTIGVDTMTIRYTNNDHGGSSFNVEWENHKHKITLDCYVQNIGGGAGSVTFEPGVTKWSDFKLAIQNQLLTHSDCVEKRHSALLGGYTMYLQPDYIGTEVTGDVTASFTIEDTSAAAAKGTAYMLGTAYSSAPSFSKTDTFSLYQAYVTEYYNADIVCGTMSDNTKTSLISRGYTEIAVYSNGAMQTGCYAKAQDNENEQSVYAVDAFGGFTTFEEICAWMAANASSVSIDELDDATTREPSEVTTTTTTTGGGDDETETNKLEEACYEHAKSLGWVICPMIFGLREVSESIYEWIEPLIRVNDTTVSQLGNQNSNLFKAWNTFRGFANVIFVILFMFVIFSQLTGWGIDNYGIKRLLPKLIITAILVNLSFIVCAVAVDASNIIGKGIEGLFEQLGGTIMMKDVTGAEAGNIVSGAVAVSDSVSAQKHIVGEVVSWLVVAAGGIGVGFLIQGWAIIIPILLFLLTVIISIIFAMIILGLRQAIVIILIVLAPVAFACSVLPNTESIFKKWFSAFKGILVVYPVVGALIGAGYFTSSLIYTGEDSGTGLIMTIVAGLLSVIPYFLIPSLTRKSLDGIGRIGERIGNIGKSANTRAKGAINGAEATKNFRADQAANAKYRRANSKLSRWMDNKSLEAAEKNKGKKGVGAWVANHTIASNGRLRAVKRHDEARVDNARESVVQGAQAARNSMNRMEHGGFAARAANLEDKALEDAIADQTSLWDKDGTFSSDSKFLNEVKSAALGNDDVSKVKLEALMRKAAKGSDKQREILRDAMSAAFKTGGVSSSQAARYGAHITGNSIYKSNDRSMYDQGNAIMNAVGNGTYGSEGNTSADFVNENFVGSGFVKGKQSAESAFNYDDGEFAALAKKMSSINEQLSSGNISAEERTTLENTKQKIAETLGEGIYIKENDPNNKYANVNDHIINEMKKVIEAGYGAEGAKQFIKSDSLKVDHTDATAQSDSQQISATQAAQQIQDAVNAHRASASTDPLVQKAEQQALNAIKNGTADSVPKNVIIGPDGKPLGRA